MISISCLTYNHAPYVRQCLDGFLNQQTNFPFEVLIHDDASTDDTADIIREYEKKYPDIIKPIYQTENQYSKGISGIAARFNFTRAAGKYIAMCEGDDYWIDPHKLQKQVDFMEANPEYSLVYHRVNTFDQTLNEFKPETNNWEEIEKTYSIKDLAGGNFMHTPSILFRKDAMDLSFLSCPKFKAMDYSLWMLCAKEGKIKYFPQIMAVYRIWSGSMWELRGQKFKLTMWMRVLPPLLDKFSDDKEVAAILFTQLKKYFRDFYILCVESKDLHLLNLIMKELLTDSGRKIQIWKFLYIIYIKIVRKSSLRYYNFLLEARYLSLPLKKLYRKVFS